MYCFDPILSSGMPKGIHGFKLGVSTDVKAKVDQSSRPSEGLFLSDFGCIMLLSNVTTTLPV